MANIIPSRRDLARFDEDLFSDFFGNFWNDDRLKVDIKETDKNYELKADLPGFTKDNISVEYDRDILSIQAHKESSIEDKDEDGNYIRRERTASSFSRQFMLKNVDEAAISAKFENGVLNLALPKADNKIENRKRIEIQ